MTLTKFLYTNSSLFFLSLGGGGGDTTEKPGKPYCKLEDKVLFWRVADLNVYDSYSFFLEDGFQKKNACI